MIEPRQIVPIQIENPASMEPPIVGTKASTLSMLLSHGFEIPSFFAFQALGSRLASTLSYDRIDTDALSESLSRLRSNGTELFIVRSSAVEEDQVAGLFPGIFESISDLKSDREVIDAILRCFHSIHSERASAYCRLKGLSLEKLRMAVFVQAQIISLFSGVLFTESPLNGGGQERTMLVELTEGNGADLLLGRTNGWSYRLELKAHKLAIVPLVEAPKIRREQIAAVLGTLFPLARRIESILGAPQDIEWCSDGTRIWILQARPMSNQQSGVCRVQRELPAEESKQLLPDEHAIGLKGAAMMEFAGRQWFRKPVLFLQPQGSIQEFSDRLDKCDFLSPWITVRYSFRNQIGLPRTFVRSKLDVLHFIEDTWNTEWLSIVHGYIDVRRSFELYIAKGNFVLEHVPGIWESDNESPPDVIQTQNEKTVLLRVTKTRIAKYMDPNGTRLKADYPRPMSMLEQWAISVQPYVKALTELCGDGLPVICHFVEDEKGQWQFLNLRRSRPISRNEGRPGFLFPVSKLRDLDGWDGQRPILLRLSMVRGYEQMLRELALELPREPGMVYIDVGILSHPAIALREFGVTPVPIYLSHEQLELTENIHEH